MTEGRARILVLRAAARASAVAVIDVAGPDPDVAAAGLLRK